MGAQCAQSFFLTFVQQGNHKEKAAEHKAQRLAHLNGPATAARSAGSRPRDPLYAYRGAPKLVRNANQSTSEHVDCDYRKLRLMPLGGTLSSDLSLVSVPKLDSFAEIETRRAGQAPSARRGASLRGPVLTGWAQRGLEATEHLDRIPMSQQDKPLGWCHHISLLPSQRKGPSFGVAFPTRTTKCPAINSHPST